MSLRDHIAIAFRNEVTDFRSMFRQVPYVRIYPRRPRLSEMTVEGPIGDCAICQEEFCIGDSFVPLPCSETHVHKFHKDCIVPWLRRNKTCPVCRATISE